ncbi:hypothetical protein SADUNF_Sadunf10G0109900 [Salix dunnii]|uniref:Uncharacterized protein n=1 Tax=Salix dunnii TaxID=1413687 RepID=A0A835MQS6_9ROSI|nr:hypothetical protein SADUNF_Sadunf10G0109900 [Salix dunnii]
MQRLCTKSRSLPSVSSSHRLQNFITDISVSPLLPVNGILMASFGDSSILFASVSTLPLCKALGFFCYVLCMIIHLSILFCMHEY